MDEDAQARDALERALVEADYGVVSARDSLYALCQSQHYSIDVALLDLGRDAGTGWNTAARLTQ